MKECVSVILVKPDGSVLAQHRDNNPNIQNPNKWCACGGAPEEYDPSLQHSVARELFEETRYEVNLADLHFLFEDSYINQKGVTVHRIIFWAEYDSKQEINCYEGQEIKFIFPKEFNSINFADGHKNYFRMASQNTISVT